jgi:hypothetical protein
MNSFRHSERSSNFACTQLDSEAVKMYFTSDPLAFMKERFISGCGKIAVRLIIRLRPLDALSTLLDWETLRVSVKECHQVKDMQRHPMTKRCFKAERILESVLNIPEKLRGSARKSEAVGVQQWSSARDGGGP